MNKTIKCCLAFLIPAIFFISNTFSQEIDSLTIRHIFSYALTHTQGYETLRRLCKDMPGRLDGSEAAEKAEKFIYDILINLAADSVYRQKVTVPCWNPGNIAEAKIISSGKVTTAISVCAMGPSIPTSAGGIHAPVIEVNSIDELNSLSGDKVSGKIVFFNSVMDPSKINLMEAYSDAVKQRVHGAAEAAKFGAVAALVRSVTNQVDDFPHTGVMRYEEGVEKIPAAAVSTKDAELLSRLLKQDANLTCTIKMNCKSTGEKTAHNIIAEIKGIKNPGNIILAGAHLDSWHLGQGAHDDGAGCIHVMDVLRIFNSLQIHPNNTIRVCLFADEEISQQGAKIYAESVRHKTEKYIAAIESDRGGMVPVGFTIDAADAIVHRFVSFKKYFLPYLINRFEKGHGGTDINPLKVFNVPLIGFLPESQRYFEYHHSANDTFEQVHLRELQLGSAAVASLVYLIDSYGL